MCIWYDRSKQTADFISEKIINETGMKPVPEFLLILGTSFGDSIECAKKICSIPYSTLPNFTSATVKGHAGNLLYCRINGMYGFIMQGRLHFYEGNEPATITLPIRAASLLGVKYLILTNAAGAINPEYNLGDFVIITDHLSFFSKSPLYGVNEENFGSSFVSMDNCYDTQLTEIAAGVAKKLDYNVHQGIYAYMTGPQFETHAEIRALRILGADMVGMSTVQETVVARHCGMKVLCISCVTNMAAGVSEKAISHEDVNHMGRKTCDSFIPLVSGIIEVIGGLSDGNN